MVPLVVVLTYEQGRLWTKERLDAVKESSEAQKVHKSSRGRDTIIEISGTDKQKEKASAAIEEINGKLNCTETMEDVPESSRRYLTGRGKDRLREIEQNNDVSVTVDRKGECVKIVGAADSVVAAKTQLEQFLSTQAAAETTREFEIEWDEGRVVIGKGGSTVNQIRRESGLDTLKVEEAGEKKKVLLRGSQEACDAAEKMIQEALKKDKARTADRAAKASSAGADSAVAEKAPVQEAPAKTEADEKSAADKRSSNKKWSKGPAKVEYDASKASFPSLGGESDGKGGKKGKRGPKNSAWKSVGEEDGEENDGGEDGDEVAGDDSAAAAEKEDAGEPDGGN